jgi:hypothetical protein
LEPTSCQTSRALRALRPGDVLVVWKLDRLGRSLRHLVNLVHDLTSRGIGLAVLTGHGAAIDTTTPAGKLIFGIFASLAEFERELLSEQTRAGLASARARGRKGGRRPKMTPAKLRLAQAAMGQPETTSELCARSLGSHDQRCIGTSHLPVSFEDPPGQVLPDAAGDSSRLESVWLVGTDSRIERWARRVANGVWMRHQWARGQATDRAPFHWSLYFALLR